MNKQAYSSVCKCIDTIIVCSNMLADNHNSCREQCKHTPIQIRWTTIKLIIIRKKDEQIEAIRYGAMCMKWIGDRGYRTMGCSNSTKRFIFMHIIIIFTHFVEQKIKRRRDFQWLPHLIIPGNGIHFAHGQQVLHIFAHPNIRLWNSNWECFGWILSKSNIDSSRRKNVVIVQ